jgi:hypothetical protein
MSVGNVLLVSGFLILCGIWILLYAACCVAGKCDDEDGTR